jgi:hypothetical protein
MQFGNSRWKSTLGVLTPLHCPILRGDAPTNGNTGEDVSERMSNIMKPIWIAGLASVSFAVFVETALAGINGVPGPIVGVGLPALVLIGGAYWVSRKLFGR